VLYRIFEDEVMRIVVPNTLVKNVVAFSHGSKAVGLWGVLRTTVPSTTSVLVARVEG
jgi:hypothetical protein